MTVLLTVKREKYQMIINFTVEPPLSATSLQWPLFFVPADSPYIDSCLNLFTMVTSLQWQQPLKPVPNCQNTLSTMVRFFSD